MLNLLVLRIILSFFVCLFLLRWLLIITGKNKTIFINNKKFLVSLLLSIVLSSLLEIFFFD